MTRNHEAEAILGNLTAAVRMLESALEFTWIIPEVRVNLAYALPDARNTGDVAAIEGRITAVRGLPRAAGLPAFGASDHMARLILEARKYDPVVNAGINFRYDANIRGIVRRYCSQRNLLFGSIDRSREPPEVAAIDRHSMPWKIGKLVADAGGLPRFFYEGEGWGKEPLFVVLGVDGTEVASIALDIARRYHSLVTSRKA